MSTPHPPRESPPAGLPPRFSLRTLLVATTFFAIACAFVVVLPMAISQTLVGAFWFVASGWLLVGVFFGRDDQRAFCIGAALVASSMWTGLGGRYMQGIHELVDVSYRFQIWADLVVIAASAVANGWCCVWARRYFARSSGS